MYTSVSPSVYSFLLPDTFSSYLMKADIKMSLCFPSVFLVLLFLPQASQKYFRRKGMISGW